MVEVDEELKKKVQRLYAAARGESLPDDEEVLRTESRFDKEAVPNSLLTENLPGFQMSYEELDKAVEDYDRWLSELNSDIRKTGSKIKTLATEFDEISDREFDPVAVDEEDEVAFALQLANEEYEELQDERDEVRAKYQILRRKKAKASRKIRRQMREEKQDNVDWEEYNSQEARGRQREDRMRRQRQKQGVRAARNDLERGSDTEKPDMSAVRDIVGEDKAQQVQESINKEIEVENEWLNENNDEEEEDELL